MSRDDYISKLFIKNQDKLEQAPSEDLWSKLELTLDQQMPVAGQAPAPKIFSLSRYFAAASVLVAVVSTVYLLKVVETSNNKEMAMDEPLAIYTETVVDEAEPYEDYKSLPTEMVEIKEEKEIKEQEEKLVEAVKEKVLEEKISLPDNSPVASKIELGDIEIVDENEAEDIILIEPEEELTITSTVAKSVAATNNANLYLNDAPVSVAQDQKLNYNRTVIPQMANSSDNSRVVEEVLNKSKKATRVERQRKISASRVGRSARNKIVSKKKGTKKIKSPMATAHPRLYPFGFLLGKWEDDHETEGKSYEVWTLKNTSTLVGKGYKLSKDAERIFEEVMKIEFRDNQIFLVMSLSEDKGAVDYMLVDFDNERFEFEQNTYEEYPSKVIFQQSGLDGYSVIIVGNRNFLNPDQQRYLENRNRVSNIQAVRTMRYVE